MVGQLTFENDDSYAYKKSEAGRGWNEVQWQRVRTVFG